MPTPFVITMPKGNTELRDEIEEQLSANARVTVPPPSYLDAGEIKMIVELVGIASAIAANGTAIITFLLLLKDRFKQQGRPSGIRVAVPGKDDVPLDAVDEAILKRIVGLEG